MKSKLITIDDKPKRVVIEATPGELLLIQRGLYLISTEGHPRDRDPATMALRTLRENMETIDG